METTEYRKKYQKRKEIEAVCQSDTCEKKFKHARYRIGKYCNQSCQQDQKRNIYIAKWLSGEESGTMPMGKFSNHIKTYMVRTDPSCNICGITEWNDQKIIFDMDHIDGDSLHNRPENLRLLCPNCHSQTDSYKGGNKGKSTRIHHYKK